MLEEKLIGGIKKSVIAVGAAMMIASCGGGDDGDECIEPNYNTKPVAGMNTTEISSSLSPEEYLLEVNGDSYAIAVCPSGCTYSPIRGCCWCPDPD